MAFYDLVETPVGTLFVGGSVQGLHRLDFLEAERGDPGGHGVHSLDWSLEQLERDAGEAATRDAGPAAEVTRQLHEYFEGERTAFDLPLSPRGTDFQRSVWRALTEIPAGETRSYGEVAAMVGRPSASRAVGAANGQNPLVIIVPCHRVVGANGTLTGYGGGLGRKRWLLDHETHSLPLFAGSSGSSESR